MKAQQLTDITLTRKEIVISAGISERTLRNNEVKWGLDKLIYGSRVRSPRLYKKKEAMEVLLKHGVILEPI